ncbi:hypothetical protein J6S35_03415 [Candidatus Saccharibacteria bacterium]|nr:hypothetical protein [Candidatus Saccharibacteria bacterium]
MYKKSLRTRLKNAIFGVLFAFLGVFGLAVSPVLSAPVYAEPESSESSGNNASENTANVETCYDQVPGVGWLICPNTSILGKAIDAIYSQIEKLLVVEPVSFEDSSPIYQIWQIMRDITNIVFIIFLLIVVYSQITGIGISNYGIKKALPKLIIAAILVNLSYILCAIAVDLSNIFGASIRGLFENVQMQAIDAGGIGDISTLNWTRLTGALIGGGAVAGIAIIHFIWPLIAALIGAIISVLIGLITLGLRQALVTILVMISPVAFVCYLLPNTEKWFKKWKDVFISMIIFYPMFSFLFGASQLAGWALIASAVNSGSAFMLIVGMAVQVLPLILAIALMKMSGTILGAVSNRLSNLANRPREGIGKLAAQNHELSRLRRINNSTMPSARLQRYLDKRNRLRSLDIDNESKIRAGHAEIYAQNRILGRNHYDPAYNDEYKKGTMRLGATASGRSAKEAMNVALEAQTATKNTAHILGNYGDYHKDTLKDAQLQATGGSNYLDFYRANLAEQNDAFADEDWVIGQYDKFRNLYGEPNKNDRRDSAQRTYDYKHYITGAAGALGMKGDHTVLGEVISKSAKNEAARKSYTNLMYAKWGYGKSDARSMLVGYYVDDDGFATTKPDAQGRRERLSTYTDASGNTINIKERSPGEFLKYHPEYLTQSAYDIKDEHGYYYNAKDQDGNFIARVYKNDGPAMKEIFQNWDMPINDPINGLYGILTGVSKGDYKQYGLDAVGLSNLSTTLNRATLSANFKEKASFAGPMYATSIGQRYIKDFVHLNIARLDNLIKTAKPSGFNTQDAAEFGQLRMLMDPANWDWMLFDENSLRSFLNVNGEHMKGTEYQRDDNGKIIFDKNGNPKIANQNIPIEQATFEQLKNTIFRKYLLPAAPKFATMMSRITNGIIDNQKPGVADNWNGLLDSMEKWNSDEWSEKYPLLKNPFAKQTNDTISRAREVSRRIRPEPTPELRKRMQESEAKANNRDVSWRPYQRTEEDRTVDREFLREQQQAIWNTWGQDPAESKNYTTRIDIIAASSVDDTMNFIRETRAYLEEVVMLDPRIDNVIEAFENYVSENQFDATVTVEDYANELKGYIAQATL